MPVGWSGVSSGVDRRQFVLSTTLAVWRGPMVVSNFITWVLLKFSCYDVLLFVWLPVNLSCTSCELQIVSSKSTLPFKGLTSSLITTDHHRALVRLMHTTCTRPPLLGRSTIPIIFLELMLHSSLTSTNQPHSLLHLRLLGVSRCF